MRGRGERIAPLGAEAAARLRGRNVLIFKPAFGISTPWAYGWMAANPATYLSAASAEAALGEWLGAGAAPAESLLFNNLESAAFAKHLALPVLLDQLRARFGLRPRMSGSGSACFALLPDDPAALVPAVTAAIREAWGPSAWVIATRLA